MLAFVFVLAAITVKPDPIIVEVGKRAWFDLSLPYSPTLGAHIRGERRGIVEGGWIPPNRRSTRAAVIGLKPGQTNLLIDLHNGMSTDTVRIATVIVIPACEMPAVTLPEPRMRVTANEPVTLSAMTSGAPVTVDWYEGDTLLGTGNPLTIELAAGTHHLRAEAKNGCGTATSELEIEAVLERRRSVRH